MKYAILLLIFLTTSCCTKAQKDSNANNLKIEEIKYEIRDGMLASFDGIELLKFELDVEDFDVEQITLNHLLCLSTDECDKELTIELLKRGANPNFKCEEVDDVITNLAFCEENGVELTKLLLSKGANINGADQDNDSFLSYSISTNNIELTKFLIDNGANKVQRDTNRNMGCLPIHGVESMEMLKLLIDNDFKLGETCDNGRTLLHFAARENYVEIVKYLLEHKLVEKNQKDKNGDTALVYAQRRNNKQIEELLK
ncbi:MAG: ankyrin repeat domain-containing protein [Chitinophagales bacterium]|nr:ankyrin repeat domain-containing protein [Chitinophagales bacterium]